MRQWGWYVRLKVTWLYYYVKATLKLWKFKIEGWWSYKRVLIFDNKAVMYTMADVRDKAEDITQFAFKSLMEMKHKETHLTERNTLAVIVDFRKKRVSLYTVGELMNKTQASRDQKKKEIEDRKAALGLAGNDSVKL